MKITKITVYLVDSKPDKITISTDLPCPYNKEYLPSQPNLDLEFDASYDTGADYVRKVFKVEPEIKNFRMEKIKSSK